MSACTVTIGLSRTVSEINRFDTMPALNRLTSDGRTEIHYQYRATTACVFFNVYYITQYMLTSYAVCFMFCMFYMCSSATVIYCYLRAAAVSVVLHLAVLLIIL